MKIAIAGYGTEGAVSYEYWNTPENQVVIIDERPVDAPIDASVITGEGVFSRLEGYDIVIRSPGVSPRKIITDGVVWSATNEFFARCAEREIPIIGVTGTKGKGTTSSLITSILRTAGKTVHLVGNIGTPALDILSEIQSDDIVVYELSSFQLWDLQRSPQVAVVLMIEPDHLEVHSDFTEYAQAKANIARNQTTIDRVVYNVDNEWSKQIAEASPGQLLSYPSDHTAHVRGDMIYYGNTEVCNVDNIQMDYAASMACRIA
jgi:UDP-N-acetylmuramoylalanine--D-glutamate ligase